MPSEDSTASSELEELRRELAEAREQRSATAEILRVISSSPTDLERVFAEVASSATRLCDASDATIHQAEGATYFASSPTMDRSPRRIRCPSRV